MYHYFSFFIQIFIFCIIFTDYFGIGTKLFLLCTQWSFTFGGWMNFCIFLLKLGHILMGVVKTYRKGVAGLGKV